MRQQQQPALDAQLFMSLCIGGVVWVGEKFPLPD